MYPTASMTWPPRTGNNEYGRFDQPYGMGRIYLTGHPNRVKNYELDHRHLKLNTSNQEYGNHWIAPIYRGRSQYDMGNKQWIEGESGKL